MRGALLYISLGVATLAVSWASIFIRLADADPIATAFYRMALAALILAPFSSKGLISNLRKLTATDLWLMALSGIFLGFHFAVWITSLKYTSISNSVIIVATQPFFVAIMEALFLKDKISRNAIVGMVLAFVGMVIIARYDFHLSGDNFLGDILALLGAITAGCYLMVGRRIRQKLHNRFYILPVYTLAALTLLVIAVVLGSPLTGFPVKSWIYFLLLALVPTILGHSLYNYLLKYVRAHLVAVTILGEPIGATFFAAVIFAEIPHLATYIGGALILMGILLALFRTKPKLIEL
jgi:drug/metabolite transporter (DMT)-like permease